jgi:hypothetical protein
MKGEVKIWKIPPTGQVENVERSEIPPAGWKMEYGRLVSVM